MFWESEGPGLPRGGRAKRWMWRTRAAAREPGWSLAAGWSASSPALRVKARVGRGLFSRAAQVLGLPSRPAPGLCGDSVLLVALLPTRSSLLTHEAGPGSLCLVALDKLFRQSGRSWSGQAEGELLGPVTLWAGAFSHLGFSCCGKVTQTLDNYFGKHPDIRSFSLSRLVDEVRNDSA